VSGLFFFGKIPLGFFKKKGLRRKGFYLVPGTGTVYEFILVEGWSSSFLETFNTLPFSQGFLHVYNDIRLHPDFNLYKCVLIDGTSGLGQKERKKERKKGPA
jgi:hypothetical protein